MSRIFFLGSGGGRWNTIGQNRATAGFRIELVREQIHVDPGPGAIVKCREFGIDPRKTTAVACTHCHLDHYNDLEVMVEAMSMGDAKRGVLLGARSVLDGYEKFEPVLSDYHLKLPARVEMLEAGKRIELDECPIVPAGTRHEDPTCCGLRFKTGFGDVSYTSDTEYFDGLSGLHEGSRILILNVMRPDSNRIPGHLCTDDAIRVIKEAHPEMAVLQHFGLKMIFANPQMQAKRAEKECGVKVVAAHDGMTLGLERDEQLTLQGFGGRPYKA